MDTYIAKNKFYYIIIRVCDVNNEKNVIRRGVGQARFYGGYLDNLSPQTTFRAPTEKSSMEN